MARIVSFFVIFFTSVLVAYFMYFKPEEDLPVYQPSQLNPALVDPSAMRAEDHRILDFELVNHLGDTVTLADVEGQILMVDFFFSRCATICPLMTQNLQRIHDRLDAQMPVRILSHSVTPQADSVWRNTAPTRSFGGSSPDRKRRFTMEVIVLILHTELLVDEKG